MDDEGNEEGIRCAAAPVRNDCGELVAGIDVSGRSVGLSRERIEQDLTTEVMGKALEISKRLSYKEE